MIPGFLFFNNYTLIQIPVGRLRNGIYLLRIENEKGVMTKKIVIDN